MKTKNDIVNEIHKSGAGSTTKQATDAIVTKALSVIGQMLRSGEEVRLNEFGTFKVKSREARTGRNPASGESIQIAASKAVGFKASSVLNGSL